MEALSEFELIDRFFRRPARHAVLAACAFAAAHQTADHRAFPPAQAAPPEYRGRDGVELVEVCVRRWRNRSATFFVPSCSRRSCQAHPDVLPQFAHL